MRKKSKEDISRNKARKLMRILNPKYKRNLCYTHVIHHKDRNPFNNKLSNLQIVNRSRHRLLHPERKPEFCDPLFALYERLDPHCRG